MVRPLFVAALALVVLVVDAQDACRHYCKSNNPPGSVYCCDDGSGVGQFAEHRGKCPKRPVCPPTIQKFRGPKVCAHDGQCARNEKCCYDACLEHHACLLAVH
ncbi:uncharacterized protein LOC127009493 [Eriocheir sinensis]|uniref:uncharacterized protein LOC127009493 n=1 Tax=Eriocheir sinensis TaxID=95602 RepID=UPI0021C70EF4|nr:uncharacterized protein LOC127009493 [Eriocheir sinensis]